MEEALYLMHEKRVLLVKPGIYFENLTLEYMQIGMSTAACSRSLHACDIRTPAL